jgi:hypothetical protein
MRFVALAALAVSFWLGVATLRLMIHGAAARSGCTERGAAG